MVKETIMLDRVSYGSQKTPRKDREYVMKKWGSPVGNKAEWRKWAKEHGYSVKFRERPRVNILIHQGSADVKKVGKVA